MRQRSTCSTPSVWAPRSVSWSSRSDADVMPKWGGRGKRGDGERVGNGEEKPGRCDGACDQPRDSMPELRGGELV